MPLRSVRVRGRAALVVGIGLAIALLAGACSDEAAAPGAGAGTVAEDATTTPDEPDFVAVDDAVQIALFNNRGLQASFLELGITEAEVVQAGRLPNPGFSFGRKSRGDEREIERGLHINLARLLVMPMVQRMEAQRFQQTQGRVATSVLSLAAVPRCSPRTCAMRSALASMTCLSVTRRCAVTSAVTALRVTSSSAFALIFAVRSRVQPSFLARRVIATWFVAGCKAAISRNDSTPAR